MKILVTGENGQVAQSIKFLAEKSVHEFFFWGRQNLDLLQPQNIYSKIINLKPDIIISTAAYTEVDKAETETEIANLINSTSIGEIAKAARDIGACVIHFSTDYVYDGRNSKPYIETDKTNPINQYGKTKLLGENLLTKYCPESVILRTQWVYSEFGKNFVKTMLRLYGTIENLNIVCDQFGSPTYAGDLAHNAIKIAEAINTKRNKEMFGIFHISSKGITNWADFAKAIFAHNKKSIQYKTIVNPILSIKYKTDAQRPLYTSLNCDKIKNIYGIELPNWQFSLDNNISNIEEKGFL